jgi:large subunit ribosomal protein L22
VLSKDLIASARLRYLGTSAQKVRLVIDLIRGRPVEDAIAVLGQTKKRVAREIGGLLDSAVANARQKRQDIDVDSLYVHTAFVDGGPSLKRIRPAPMGRAFRVQKRMCHVTLGLGQIAEPQAPVRRAAEPHEPAAEGVAPKPPARARKSGTAAAKAARTKSKTAARTRKKTKRPAKARS